MLSTFLCHQEPYGEALPAWRLERRDRHAGTPSALRMSSGFVSRELLREFFSTECTCRAQTLKTSDAICSVANRESPECSSGAGYWYGTLQQFRKAGSISTRIPGTLFWTIADRYQRSTIPYDGVCGATAPQRIHYASVEAMRQGLTESIALMDSDLYWAMVPYRARGRVRSS
jgi:hypothetical protein